MRDPEQVAKRPLLSGDDPQAKLEEILNNRRSQYEQVCVRVCLLFCIVAGVDLPLNMWLICCYCSCFCFLVVQYWPGACDEVGMFLLD